MENMMEDISATEMSGNEVAHQGAMPDNTPVQTEATENNTNEGAAEDDNQSLHDTQPVESPNDNPEVSSSDSLGDEHNNVIQGGDDGQGGAQQEEQNLNGGNHGGSVSFRGSCDDKCIKCNVSSSKAFWS